MPKLAKSIDNSTKSDIIKSTNINLQDDSYILPNAISASTLQEKIQGYFLNSNHPTGKHKARVINSVLGYHYENWNELSDKIFEAIQTTNVEREVITNYGVKYRVPITIVGKKIKVWY